MNSILRFPESLAIGVHAMVFLAGREGKPSNMGEIAEAFSISHDHLAKVFQQLKRARLVDSVRGPAGGYVLQKPAKDISLLDVFEAMQGTIVPHGCMFKDAMCHRAGCILGRKIMELELGFIGFLKDFNLQSYSQVLKNPDSDGCRTKQ